ncbi:MAG: hypothetical protein AB7S26_14780 [Sandaracinaceae bacterium]
MSTCMRATSLLAALTFVLGACDDGATPGDDGGGSDGGRSRDASARDSGAVDAAARDAASGADAGAPGPSVHPDVPLVNGGDPSWDSMVFEALNIVPDEIGRITEVFGIVRNDDPTLTLCSLSPDLHLIDSTDTDLGFIGLVVTGAPMESAIVASCVDRGAIGLVYGNVSGVVDLTTIARMEVFWHGSGSTSAVPYGDVVSEGEMLVDPYGSGNYLALAGTLRVNAGTIHNPGVEVLPIVDGLPITHLFQRELADFGPGSSWTYRTTAVEADFTEYRVAYDYREPFPIYADTPEVRVALSARDRFDALRRANEDRLPHILAP